MNWGVCLGGQPSPGELRALGVGWVRVVALPGIEWHVYRYHQGGIKVAGVIARESGDPEQYRQIPWDALIVGNEMDGPLGGSSWTMSPEEFYALWYTCEYFFPSVPRIIGGLASGNPYKGEEYWLVYGAAALAVHPYAKTAPQARLLLQQYKALSGMPLWVTEWHRDAVEIPGFMAMLAEETEAAFWFAWDESVPGFGLIDLSGVPKDKYWAMKEVLHMPEFVLGFKDLADYLGAQVVGEPVEDEHYFPDGKTSLQVSDKGVMVYSQQGNKALFLPGLTLPNP